MISLVGRSSAQEDEIIVYLLSCNSTYKSVTMGVLANGPYIHLDPLQAWLK